jgi:hypothetical protein
MKSTLIKLPKTFFVIADTRALNQWRFCSAAKDKSEEMEAFSVQFTLEPRKTPKRKQDRDTGVYALVRE